MRRCHSREIGEYFETVELLEKRGNTGNRLINLLQAEFVELSKADSRELVRIYQGGVRI